MSGPELLSRPRHCNDNALVKPRSRRSAQAPGYSHIRHRREVTLRLDYLNLPELPSALLVRRGIIDAKGKRKKRYPCKGVMTPLEKLASLPEPERYLKAAITLSGLQREATRISDNEAARRLNQARAALFQSINRRLKRSA
jgi:hypothetical protein